MTIIGFQNWLQVMGSSDKILDFFLLTSCASVLPVVIFPKVIDLVLHDANVA